MASWKIFISGSLLFSLVSVGGFILSRHKLQLDSQARKAVQGVRLLVISLWLASLSVLAYIAFVFGKR